MKTAESDALRACLDYLHLRGHFVFRVNCGAFKTKQGRLVNCTDMLGVADIIGLTLDGKPLAIECKSNTGKQSEEQELFEKNWVYRHGLYILARGIDDLKEAGL